MAGGHHGHSPAASGRRATAWGCRPDRIEQRAWCWLYVMRPFEASADSTFFPYFPSAIVVPEVVVPAAASAFFKELGLVTEPSPLLLATSWRAFCGEWD